MNKSVCILWSIIALASLGRAADEVPALKEPLLPRTSERASWTISFVAKNPDSPLAKQLPKQIEVSKDGTTYREILTDVSGRKTEKWIVNGMQVQETVDGRVMKVMLTSSYYVPDFSDYTRSDFEDVEWIDKSNYRGISLSNKIPVHAFEVAGEKRRFTPRELRERANNEGPTIEDLVGRTYIAYLDIHTQLPVLLDDGLCIRTYSYGPASGGLTPPAKFAEVLDAWKRKLTKQKSVPSPP